MSAFPTTFIASLLSLLLFIFPAVAQDFCPLNSTSTATSFDVLVLSLVWPFSSCIHLRPHEGETCLAPPVSFVTRGLWPTVSSGPQPSCCLTPSSYQSKFNPAEIIDLAPQLRHVFPDLSSPSSPLRLWQRQWDVFGSCSNLSCRTYFHRIISLYRRFDFYRILSAAGIVASDHRTHALSSIQAVVESSVGGARVHIFCQNWHDGRASLLDGINICLDKTGGTVVDCPANCTRIASKDQSCCAQGSRLTIPFWSRESGGISSGNAAGEGGFGDRDAGKDKNSTSGGGAVENEGVRERGRGYWVGQAIGFIMVAGGVGFWIFKQSTLDRRRRNVAQSQEYQRIT